MPTFHAMSRPPSTAQGHITLAVGSSTDQGNRLQNEDSLAYYTVGPALVAIVADGMGGGIDGKRFSERAVALVREHLSERADEPGPTQVERAVQVAAREINALRNSTPDYRISGTTLVVAWLHLDPTGADVVVANVGDSRAYHITGGGKAELLTRDHTYGERLMDEGLSFEEAHRDPQALRLTYVLGNTIDLSTVPKFLTNVRLQPGDRLLLCTDGVSKLVSPAELGALVTKYPAQEASERVIRQALAKGSRDNVTALVIHCQPAQQHRSLLWPVFAVLVVVAIIAALMFGVFKAGASDAASQTTASIVATISPLPTSTPLAPTTTTLPSKPTSTPAPSVTVIFTPMSTKTPRSMPTNIPKPIRIPQPSHINISNSTVPNSTLLTPTLTQTDAPTASGDTTLTLTTDVPTAISTDTPNLSGQPSEEFPFPVKKP